MHPHLLNDIRCLILDVDGVCTDGKLIYGSDGNISTMTFHAQDGAGIKRMLDQGHHVAVISGNRSPIIEHRMKYLGVKHIFLGQEEKLTAFYQLLDMLALEPRHCAYVGDDLPDIPVIQLAGFGCAVANAQPEVQEAADYVTKKSGGDGAVREIINLILSHKKEQGSWA